MGTELSETHEYKQTNIKFWIISINLRRTFFSVAACCWQMKNNQGHSTITIIFRYINANDNNMLFKIHSIFTFNRKGIKFIIVMFSAMPKKFKRVKNFIERTIKIVQIFDVNFCGRYFTDYMRSD